MSSEKPVSKEEADSRARAFEEMYRESHPEGPYPPVQPKPKPESKV
jgi:hypothetical protein